MSFKPDTRSLFVVGDDAQSIYGFRGSNVDIILNFENEYPNTKEIVLNQNYRSTQPILNLAEKVLSHNPKQKKKDLFTQNAESLAVSYYLAKNERDEAEYIIRQLYDQYGPKKETINAVENDVVFEPDSYFNPLSKVKTKSNDPVSNMFDVYLESDNFGASELQSYQADSWQVPTYDWQNITNLNDCAILYRTHSQSRSLEEAFLKYNLPYRLVSGTRFLDRKEIKDVISVLKFLSNGEDFLNLSRFLPLVLKGVGAKTLQKIIAYLQDYQYPLAPKYQQQIMDLLATMQSSWQNNNSLIDLTKDILAAIGYFSYLKEEYPNKEERDAKQENIGELYSLMHPFDEDRTVDLPLRLQKFLEQTSLMSQLDKNSTDFTPRINLMSLHQSKGLEFETVFLVGVEDGLLPHQNSLFESKGIEEEVRLAYVGVTRAKRYLHLISADSRIQFGQVKANPVSRIFRPFLDSNCQRQR